MTMYWHCRRHTCAAAGAGMEPGRGKPMTKRSEFLGALVGDWHTDHYLAAVIDDLGEAEQAMLALEQAGWKLDDLRLFQGNSAVQRIDAIERRHSLAERISAAVRG